MSMPLRRTSPSTTISNNSSGNGLRRISPVAGAGTRTRSPIVGSVTPNIHHPNHHHHQQQQQQRSTPSSAQTTPRSANYLPGSAALRIKNTHVLQQQQQQSGIGVGASGAGGGGALLLGRSPRPGSTPNSARSQSVITDLEGVIGEVMRERMHGLTESRKRVEELAELHKKETEVFLQSMEQVLAQSAMATGAQRDMQEDYENLLERERREKGKMLEILQRFKTEGDRVTADLKRALADERDRHREQVARNESLMHKVREMQNAMKQQQAQVQQMKEQMMKQQQQSVTGMPPLPGRSFLSQPQQQSPNDEAVGALVELLKDHERVIDELERRNRNLEHDLRYQASKARLATGGASSASSFGEAIIDIPESIQTVSAPQQQLNLLIQQFAASSAPSDSSAAAAAGSSPSSPLSSSMPVDSMAQLVRGLLHQLRNENRMRLRVEEQSTKLVADQDEQIRKLEWKLREYENTAAANNAAAAAAAPPGNGAGNSSASASMIKIGSPSPARPGQQQQPRAANFSNNSVAYQPQPVAAAAASGFGSGSVSTTVIGGGKPRVPGTAPASAATGAGSGGPALPRLSGAGISSSNTVHGAASFSGQITPPNESAVASGISRAAESISAPVASQPKRQPTIGLEEYDTDDDLPPPRQTQVLHQPVASSASKAGIVASGKSRTNDIINSADAEFEPPAARGMDSNRAASVSSSTKAPSISVSELDSRPSLEEQLTEVANSFNDSIETWQKAAGQPVAVGGSRPRISVSNPDAEFEPAPRGGSAQ